MESLRPKGAKFDFMNREWELVLNVITIDSIQEYFDIHIEELTTVLDIKSRDYYKNVSYIIALMINEQIEMRNEDSSEKEPLYSFATVRRHINNMNIHKCVVAIISAYTLSWMKVLEEETPNV